MSDALDPLPLLGVAGMEQALRTARSIAVLGIKPESRRDLDAHQIPLYLQQVGYAILPVPTRYPEATQILGAPVRRRLTELPRPIDILNVFSKPADLAPHLADIVLVRPAVVWFQSGLLVPEAARALLEAGLAVAEDCIGCRRATLSPSWAPLEGQTGGAVPIVTRSVELYREQFARGDCSARHEQLPRVRCKEEPGRQCGADGARRSTGPAARLSRHSPDEGQEKPASLR